jgi:protein phosphatase
MLICPKCEFENPNDNKFCQTCGTSLTHKSCFKCGAEVLLNNQFCHKCGAECGTIWIAIITKKIPVVISECGDEKLAVGSFLDRGQRYQLLELLETSAKSEVVAGSVEFKVKVLDCQPFHISPIEAMLKHQSQGLIVPSVSVIGIPNIAQTYVALQQQMLPGIPIIHDAWQQDNMQIILIKDRSHWQLLTEVWQNYTTDPAQILQWCHQMIQLWEILKPVNCCQSLLELSNLRLDENQRLSLQRLYLETPADNLTVDEEPLLTIKALGRVWRS